MTREEFEQAYAVESGTTVGWLREQGYYAIECFCDWPGCQGWAMHRTGRDG